MELSDLLFYNEYENFYTMTKSSSTFKKFCEKAFGKDFSQDGFSDLSQINRILPFIPKMQLKLQKLCFLKKVNSFRHKSVKQIIAKKSLM